jgi:hypothetical protein
VKTKIVLAIMICLTVLGLSASAGSNTVLAGCGECKGVGTPGFYKKAENWGGITEIDIGGQVYTREEAIEVLKSRVSGDKWITLFKATLAAELNMELTDCPRYCILEDDTWGKDQPSTFHQAKGWLSSLAAHRPIEGSTEEWQYSHGEGLYLRLDAYNNGKLCAPSRDLFD